MCKIKYFTETILDIPQNIEKLRKQFPGYFYFEGKKAGKSGTYIVSDNTPGQNEFSEPVKSKEFKDFWFYPPKSVGDVQVFLDSQRRNKNSLSEEVLLSTGYKLNLIPATAEPRKIALSMFEDSEEVAELASPYGKLAFQIDDDLQNGKEVSLQRGAVLVGHALRKSYNIGIDMINHLGIISSDDIENLVYICLGYGEELKKNEESTSLT